MFKRNNKKGFTIAELLIVVAIIAVLVSVAVPLFVTSLKDARDNAKLANITAVREAAVAYILTEKPTDLYDTNGHLKGNVAYAYAKVSKTGEVSELTVSANATITKDITWSADTCEENGDEGYKVIVKITEVTGQVGK